MASPAKKTDVSPASREHAVKIARSTQRPGQTKEQTRLIAQGIQKGIEQYKKQQKAKARELDKKLKKASMQANTHAPQSRAVVEAREVIKYRQHWFPWVLLVISWGLMAGYFFFY